MKWTAALLVIVLALNETGSALQTLEPNAEPVVPTSEQRKADKIKAEVARRGVGEKSRVRVKLRNKLEFKGHITQIEENRFQLQIEPDWLDAETSKDRLVEIHYADVVKIHGPTEHVVKNYLRVIYDKVGLWNRVELALWYESRRGAFVMLVQ